MTLKNLKVHADNLPIGKSFIPVFLKSIQTTVQEFKEAEVMFIILKY